MGCVPFLPPRRVAMPAPSTIHLIDSGESARWGPGVLESPSLAQPCSASLSLPHPPRLDIWRSLKAGRGWSYALSRVALQWPVCVLSSSGVWRKSLPHLCAQQVFIIYFYVRSIQRCSNTPLHAHIHLHAYRNESLLLYYDVVL